MKIDQHKKAFIILLLFSFFLTGCRESAYNRIKNYIDGIKVVDTHEHQFLNCSYTSRDYSFFNNLSYFNNDLISAGSALTDGSPLRKKSVEELWPSEGEYYNYCRATSYHAQIMYGLKKLHGFDKPFLTNEDAAGLEKKIKIIYQNYFNRWFDSAFKICNFEIMFDDHCWSQYQINIETKYLAQVFRIDSAVAHIAEAAVHKEILDKNLLSLLQKERIPVASLDDYLAVIDSVFEIFSADNMVCLKNALAYVRSIDFDDVPYETASAVFKKNTFTAQDRKMLQDFLFHRIIKKSVEYKLPIQIHTGLLAGNYSWLDRSHPMKLLPLFVKYPEARFVIFHGGYPWTGDFTALGKNFPNVCLDIVWLSQISRTVAIRTLHEMLDCVPYNKICWGGDVGTIDDAAGSLELGKEVVATVLAERIEKGWLTEEVALDIARKIFRENAIRIYRLDSIRGIAL